MKTKLWSTLDAFATNSSKMYIMLQKPPESELAKSMNMNIWVVGTSNELFIKGSERKTKKKK